MAPKHSITRAQIIDAAFAIIEQDGMPSLTARNVAQKLKLSTRPVYSHFSSMKDLQKEAMRKARALMLSYMTKPYTDSIFQNMGNGAAFFARDHKTLYRLLFMENSDFKDLVDEFHLDLRRRMKKDEEYKRLTQAKRDELLFKMWTFTHGLAAFICVGLSEEDSDSFIMETIQSAGSAVIAAALKEKPGHKTTVSKRRTHA